jgi:tRNA A37 threonylcarbamoyltransferase TsaD
MKNQKKPSKKVDFAFAGLNSRVHAIIPTSARSNAKSSTQVEDFFLGFRG